MTLDNHPITYFPTDKARALLVYLAVERDRPHRREALAALLWPDQPDARARQNFRQALSHLRQALGDESDGVPFLLVENNNVQLNPAADVRLDVAEFSGLANAGKNHKHHSPDRCLPCLRRMEAMLGLYHGEFLAGFMPADSRLFEEWALLKREWLHIRAVESLSSLAAFYERMGDLEKACDTLQQQVQLEPWREEAHHQLIRLLARSGKRSVALAQYETCRRIMQTEFGAEPAEETRQFAEQIKAGQYSSFSPRPVAPSLPISSTPFIGRKAELEEIGELLAKPECRLVTIAGTGGIGKTRLALQLVEEHRGIYPDGEFWVALSSITEPDMVVPAIAQALHFSLFGKESPQSQLLNFLRQKKLLLALDNTEHLHDLPDLLSTLLHEAPGVTLLVTSRTRLALQEEWVYSLEGLPYPSTQQAAVPLNQAPQFDSVSFILQHIQRIRRDYVPGADELGSLIEICRLVEGMPLALELAAPLIAESSSTALAHELTTGLDVLHTTMHNAPERQRSLRAVQEQSWESISESEHLLFAQLAVFRGSFSGQAVNQITGDQALFLPSLVTKSLVRSLAGGRYQLHGLLRQFAAEKLATAFKDRESLATGRHAAYYAHLLAENENALKGAGQEEALNTIALEIGNLRQAWKWAAQTQELDILRLAHESLYLFFTLRSWYQEGAASFANAAAAVGDKDLLLLGELLTRQARCLEFTAPAAEATDLYERSLALFRKLGANRKSALPLYGLGYMAYLRGEYDTARRFLLESLRQSEAAGDRWGMANALSTLCLSLQRQGEFDQALDYGRQSLATRRELGDRRGIASSQNNLGLLYCALGNYADAESALIESLAICREIGHTVGAANALTSLCLAARGGGNLPKAIQYQQKSLQLFQEIGDMWGVALALSNLGQLVLESGRAPEARQLLQDAVARYRQLGIKSGLTNALSNLGWACDVLGLNEEAAHHLHEALSLSLELGDLPFSLEILTRVAALLSRQDQKGMEKAPHPLVLLDFVLRHPALLDETRRTAVELQAQLKSRNLYLPQVSPLDLPAIANATLDALEKMLHFIGNSTRLC